MNRQQKKIAYSFVIADLLHYGHIRLLKTARENSDYHICGLISDEACHLWQGVNICNYDERKAVIESLDSVDEIMLQETMDPTENIKLIRETYPDSELIIVHGDDWKTMPGREYIESVGGKIIQPEYYEKLSRDHIISKFKQSIPDGTLRHELFTHHFRVGDIKQFSKTGASPLVATKADTLKNFKDLLKNARIEKLFTCTVGDYNQHKNEIIGAIGEQFIGKIVVRSSSISEDRFNNSMAGYFESATDVDSADSSSIEEAFEKVINSYAKNGAVKPNDQILVQKQTGNIKKSGVVFTRNLENNTPYYLINYDDVTGKTDTVTGGRAEQTVWISRSLKIAEMPEEWRQLMKAVREIESYLPGIILDIEFCEQTDGTIVVFQIRSLAANARYSSFDDEKFFSLIGEQSDKYLAYTGVSEQKIFSDMAFWNPAEIIGDNPHPLDYSLYRSIITQSAWNRGLVPLGYTEINKELMTRFGNKPFIDVGISFSSLIPAAVDEALNNKLTEYYLERLQRDTSAHDKIEFEIALSCWDFTLNEKIKTLHSHGFTKEETGALYKHLSELTAAVLSNYEHQLSTDLKALDTLETMTDDLQNNVDPGDCSSLLDAASQLLDMLPQLGTAQFSRIAREAFIASSLCRSLVAAGVYSGEEMDAFMSGVSSVTTQIDRDTEALNTRRLSRDNFLMKYGHLRAGTYDITSYRYDQIDFEKLAAAKKISVNRQGESLDPDKLRSALDGTPMYEFEPEMIIRFIKSATEQREYFKFRFTRTLSAAIEMIAEAAGLLGLTREDAAFLELPVIKSFANFESPEELGEFYRVNIEAARKKFLYNSNLILPAVISAPDDFLTIKSTVSRPNFITSKVTTGEIVDLDSSRTMDIDRKIVIINKADPGYDWIFTRNIKGIITRYGGAASHMAIRCAEFGIPAAIGCGAQIYKKVSGWQNVQLDCRRKMILKAMS